MADKGWRKPRMAGKTHTSTSRATKPKKDALLEERVRTKLDDEGIDQKYVEAVASFLKEQGLDVDDIEVDEQTEYLGVEEGKREYMVFADSDDAKEYALSRVKDDLNDSPENFNQDWLQGYVDTEKMARELLMDERDHFREMAEEQDLKELMKDVNQEACDLDAIKEAAVKAKYEQEYPDEDEEGNDKDKDDADHLETEEMLEKLIEDDHIDISNANEFFDYDALVEMYVENRASEVESDPVGYIDGMFGKEDKAKFIVEHNYIDVEKAAEAAIQADGVAHFLNTYDGNEIDLDGGGVAFRTN